MAALVSDVWLRYRTKVGCSAAKKLSFCLSVEVYSPSKWWGCFALRLAASLWILLFMTLSQVQRQPMRASFSKSHSYMSSISFHFYKLFLSLLISQRNKETLNLIYKHQAHDNIVSSEWTCPLFHLFVWGYVFPLEIIEC